MSISGDSLRLVRCEAGGQNYCLDMDCVQSIQRGDRFQHEPGAAGLLGWLPGKGARIPAYSLQQLFEKRARPDTVTGTFLVLASQRGPWAVSVDKVSRAIEVGRDQVAALPSILAGAHAGRVKGIVALAEEFSFYLSSDGLHPENPAEVPGPSLPERRRSAPSGMSEGSGTPAQRIRRMLMFELPSSDQQPAALLCGLSISQVPEVVSYQPAIPLPASPDRVVGLVRWRDRPVPLVDLGRQFGLGTLDYQPGVRLVIARGTDGGELCAIPATSLRGESLPIQHSPFKDDLPVDKTLLRGVFTVKGKTLLVPDIDAILSE